jgi:CheY-like chemotaxis protein
VCPPEQVDEQSHARWSKSMSMPRGQSEPFGPERRILVIDDNPSICEDFKKILCPALDRTSLASLEASLFGRPSIAPGASAAGYEFRVDTAGQGSEGLAAVRRMARQHTPYALAFIDMRMPPGWDGVETAARIWEADPAILIVICSAYSDYSWHEVVRRLKRPDLRLLQKPFETKDVLHLAWSLTSKRLRQPGP